MRTSMWIVGGLLAVSSVAAADPPSETAVSAPAPQLRIVEGWHHGVVWVPVLDGDQLSEPEFLRLVGRDGDATAIDHHRMIGMGAIVASMATTGLMTYELVKMHGLADWGPCFGAMPPGGSVSTCTSNADAAQARAGQSHETTMWVAGGASVGLLVLGLYELASTPHVGEAEAAALAERYNSTHVTPYASSDGGGLQVGGHF